ncbi:chromosome partition protein Smc [Nitrospirota bacterium]|nr:chromosome partition protein Smc [Nitrospirota bacterium]GDX88489.1 chromosome partition protein Smc [Nitrospirota bacterium]
MYLKSLEMLGFKSFDEAKIQFPDGVTAIVGPNGSGKSNVVDAILWVLGEQSTKALRSEKMEDVIFNGTELRKPLGMAEVSLVISGLDRINVDPQSNLSSQLSEYQELMITRRLYRNGESEYLINKTVCRLKDVRSLLLDTRAGTKGHTVIAQGQIEQIINASTQDRRELIEETAGIIRYKKQKAEALRKLDSTQQNLLRVRDIIAEVKKQLNSLERQARQARSYQTLHEEAKSLEIQLLTNEYRVLRTAITDVGTELQQLEDRESGQAAELAGLNAEREQVKFTIATASEAIGQRRDELSKLEQQQSQALTASEVERNRGELYAQQQSQGGQELERLAQEQQQSAAEAASLEDMLVALERECTEREQAFATLEGEMKKLVEQRTAVLAEEERGRRDALNLAVLVANTEQALVQLATRIQEATDREARLIREQEDFRSQHVTAADKRQTLQQDCQAAEQLVADLRRQRQAVEESSEHVEAELVEADQSVLRQSEELAAVDSHLRTLQGVLQEDMGYGRRGDEESTALKACDGVRDAIAEWLVVPAGWDRAVEAILGERVKGWFVDSPAVACEAIAFLQGKDLGRGTFIPQQPRWAPRDAAAQSWWSASAGQSGVIGRAVDLISAQGGREAARDYLFDRIVFVETLTEAMALWSQQSYAAPDGPVLVTRAGEVLDAAGVMTGGHVSETGGLLQRRREVLHLESQRVSLTEGVEQGKQRRERLLAQGQELREQSRQLVESLRNAELRGLSLQKDEAGLQHMLEDLARRIDTLTNDARQGLAEVQRLNHEVQSTQAQLVQWMAEKIGQEAVVGRVRDRVVQIDQDTQRLQQRFTEAQLVAQEIRTTREHHRRDLLRLSQQQHDASARIEALTGHVEGLAVSIGQSQIEREQQEGRCRELGESSSLIKAQLVELQEAQAQNMTVAHQLDAGLEEVRHLVSSLRESRMALEVKKAEVRVQLGTVESTLCGTYQVDPATLPNAPMAEMTDEQLSLGEAPIPEERPAVDEMALREQLQKLREKLDRLGPINLAAIHEHQELDERYQFLTTQEQDLSTSISSLKEIIQKINLTTKDMFATTFAELQQKFSEVFVKFFPGGRAELQLVEVLADETTEGRGPQEPGVDIVAQPPGKRLKSITMLSGGEKTLTAMALLFASFLIRPTPFCILDEIDAPLDEENIGRFTGVLCELSVGAQFMVITHNKRTMAIADSLFGVTMEEPGISKIVSVRLGNLQSV